MRLLRLLLPLVPALLAPALLAAEPAPPSPAEALDQLAADAYEATLAISPLTATQAGDTRYLDTLTDRLSEAGRERRRRVYGSLLEQARGIDGDALDAERRLTWRVIIHDCEEGLAGLAFPSHLMPVSHSSVSLQNMLPTLAQEGGIQPFDTIEQHEAYLRRLASFAPWVDEAIANMKRGAEQKITRPRFSIDGAIGQIDQLLAKGVKQSPFYSPARRMPESWPAEERKRLRAAYRRTIADTLLPAYRKLRDFLKDEHRERCRETLGLAGIPGGKAYYRHLVRSFTTTELTPPEIFQLGMDEVDRIYNEIGKLIIAEGHKDNPNRFFGKMQRDPKLKLNEPEAVIAAYEEIGRRVAAKLPEHFGLVHETALAIRPVPAEQAPFSPGAFYVPGLLSGKRPGTFFINTGRMPASTVRMEALYLHEAVPGHHMQHAVARERAELPPYRQLAYYGAYIEGWALYAESLGDEFGLYESAASRYGRLSLEMQRAARLVADVAIHHAGWSREKVVKLLNERALGHGVWEIDRYVGWPAQALGYKVGELRIQAMRARAEEQLGERFDLRAFHAELLRHGALPLDLLDEVIDGWIGARSPPAPR